MVEVLVGEFLLTCESNAVAIVLIYTDPVVLGFVVHRIRMDVLFCDIHTNCHQHRDRNRSDSAGRRMPSGMSMSTPV